MKEEFELNPDQDGITQSIWEEAWDSVIEEEQKKEHRRLQEEFRVARIIDLEEKNKELKEKLARTVNIVIELHSLIGRIDEIKCQANRDTIQSTNRAVDIFHDNIDVFDGRILRD